MEPSGATVDPMAYPEGHSSQPEFCKGNHSQSCTILVVDDDEAMRALLVDALQEKECRVIECEDGKEALNILKVIVPTVIVTDLKMPHGGFPYVQQLLKDAPQCPIAVITAYGDSQSKANALQCGAQGYFDKPLRLYDLKAWICQMCIATPCHNIP
jgi:DNA-binding NtrC family response regulator